MDIPLKDGTDGCVQAAQGIPPRQMPSLRKALRRKGFMREYRETDRHFFKEYQKYRQNAEIF
jgi:hypothetical protein